MNEGAAAIGWRSPDAGTVDRAVFLDRDGVINVKAAPGEYILLEWEAFRFRPDAVASLLALNDAGWPLIVVSNQSCVGRGLLTADALVGIMEAMTAALHDAGIPLAAWYCCPHAPGDGCDFFSSSIGTGIADIVSHTARKKKWRLWHNTQVTMVIA